MINALQVRPHGKPQNRGMGRGGLLLLIGSAVLLGAACRPQGETSGLDAHVAVEFDPSPPVVGPTNLRLTLTDEAGAPVRCGHLEVEGNMNHAGMRPVFARLEETAPGLYAGTIEFTMGGDWFLLVSGRRDDGVRFDRKVDVPGVKPK